MPRHARVAIVMVSIIIFAIVMLDLVRSKVEASGHAIKAAALQYSTIKKIYVSPPELIRTTPQQPAKSQ